jgi:hypothetical protein
MTCRGGYFMTFSDFFEQIEAHPSLTGLGISRNGFTVEADVGNKIVSRLSLQTVLSNDWSALERVLLGGRTHVLYHMSRVVGYYSFIHNWNKSKAGELKDRHRGNYAVEDAA